MVKLFYSLLIDLQLHKSRIDYIDLAVRTQMWWQKMRFGTQLRKKHKYFIQFLPTLVSCLNLLSLRGMGAEKKAAMI